LPAGNSVVSFVLFMIVVQCNVTFCELKRRSLIMIEAWLCKCY